MRQAEAIAWTLPGVPDAARRPFRSPLASVPENVTVLEGTFQLGMDERRDKSQIRRYQPGDFLFLQPEHPHFGGAIGRAVIQLHGPGPFEIVVVGSPEGTSA